MRGRWFKIGLASEHLVIDHVKHGEICRGIEGDWLAVYHSRRLEAFETPGEARQAVRKAQQHICVAAAYGGDWCKTFCMMPKDCSATPESES